MSVQRLPALIAQSLNRNLGHFALSGVGVVIGIATLFFFTSLGEGVRTTVLEDVFVIDQIEVVDPAAGIGLRTSGGFGGGLDDATIAQIEELDGVERAYPKMKLTFPTQASGGEALVGRDMGIEFIGDGIPVDLVQDQVTDRLEFRDHMAPRSCSEEADCPDGHVCGDDGTCEALGCDPRQSRSDSPCQGLSYCQQDREQCSLPIPLVISPYLLEVYNGSIQTALGDSQGIGGNLPRLTKDMIVGFEFDLVLGQSYVGRTGVAGQRERARIVGFSPRAMQLGATMPLEYVMRFNEQFGGQESAEIYHSVLVETERNEDVAPVTHALEDELGLELADRHRQAERAGLLILMLTLLFNLIALVILAVAALNITHTFSMMVMERRREIGLMRAIGATRRQIQSLVVGEAAVVGLIAGLSGVALGIGVSLGVDYAFDRWVGHFPFKPDTLFVWSPWMFALALATAVFFCLLGAYIPARRAGGVDPADALTGR